MIITVIYKQTILNYRATPKSPSLYISYVNIFYGWYCMSLCKCIPFNQTISIFYLSDCSFMGLWARLPSIEDLWTVREMFAPEASTLIF